MLRFTAQTEGGTNQEYSAGVSVAHVDAETAAAIVLAEFIRQVRAELDLLELECGAFIVLALPASGR